MTQRGVWQLQRLTVSYCEHSGSSRGAREFVQSFLPIFAEENKQIDVKTVLHPGRHPCLRGEYRNGTSRQVGVKNEPQEELLRQTILLRGSIGRKASLVVKQRHVQKVPSIQKPLAQTS
ncbi:hypothetical protein ABBQ32_010046 [Trebouxia sp. C0010 RCD-2024]